MVRTVRAALSNRPDARYRALMFFACVTVLTMVRQRLLKFCNLLLNAKQSRVCSGTIDVDWQ